jgi:N,N'-diacetylchitobiose transport system permease protein
VPLKTKTRNKVNWSYLLISPSLIVLAVVLGYPICRLFYLAFHHYGLNQMIGSPSKNVGFANFTSVLKDPQFWRSLRLTTVFTTLVVFSTIFFGGIIAHSMLRMNKLLKTILSVVLILVWAMPQLVAISIWRWMFSFEFSVFTYFIQLFNHHYIRRDYFVNPWSGFCIIGGVIVWGAIPFVAITLYSALTQIPTELVEAAQIDGANSRQIFRKVTFPILKPIYIILISLSVIWDFQVFSQVWVMLESRPSQDYYLLGVYTFTQSFGQSNYGKGAAISIIMIILLLAFTSYYIKTMVKIGTEKIS